MRVVAEVRGEVEGHDFSDDQQVASRSECVSHYAFHADNGVPDSWGTLACRGKRGDANDVEFVDVVPMVEARQM